MERAVENTDFRFLETLRQPFGLDKKLGVRKIERRLRIPISNTFCRVHIHLLCLAVNS